jgi:RNA polymerase sigma factor (sigma-70 family)
MSESSIGEVADPFLVERVAQRDADALSEVYRRYGPACFRLASQVTGSPSLAEDCVQEAFLAFWRRPESYRSGQGPLGPWLLGLTHHKAVDVVRRESAQQRRGVAEAARLAVQEPPAHLDPVTATSGAMEAAKVRKVLGELSAAQREVIALAYYGGYTQREIAGLVGIPLGTVKTRMMTGMRRLAERLRPLIDDAQGADG